MRSPVDGVQPDVPPQARRGVLLVGAGAQTRECVGKLVLEVVGRGGSVRLASNDSLPEGDLAGYAVLLIDARRPAAEWLQLAADPRTSSLSRLLFDTRVHRVCTSLPRYAGSLSAMVVGSKSDNATAREELARLLVWEPVVAHLAVVLERVCTTTQLALVTEFIRRSHTGSLTALAKSIARSPRSLARDCEQLGLSQPQVIWQVARIARGLTSMLHGRVSVERAAVLTGYSQASAFRRAARRALGAPVSVLVREWNQPAMVEARLRRALRRRESMLPGKP